jgi:hypothetical protein
MFKWLLRPKSTAYESDTTRFMRDFLRKHPEVIKKQQEGRALWWDKEPKAAEDVPVQRSLGKAGGAEYLTRVEKNDLAGDTAN